MPSEQSLQRKCLAYAKSKGAYCVKVINGSRAGVPDVLACYNGSFMAFEFKAPKGKTSDLQQWNIKQITEAGGIVHIINDFDNFKTIIDLFV